MPARYTIRTGCTSRNTRSFINQLAPGVNGQKPTMEERCGLYLGKTMRNLGYRTFGIGKFHSYPWNEDLGFDIHLHSEELYENQDQRKRDSYVKWLRENHPAYDYVEALMGERTEMYYQPQISIVPKELGVENWAAEQAANQINVKDEKPYFGFVSFIGPHPPFAPPLPYNRMYNPDNMENPSISDINIDLMDEQMNYMNHMIWAEEMSNPHIRILKARYYGEISYIDSCLGKILDAVEKRNDANNTLIVFTSDHGDNLGDHHSWQKECFFDTVIKIPLLVSWPKELPQNKTLESLASLTDLFGIATSAADKLETRDGVDILGIIKSNAFERKHLVGLYGLPGTSLFKIMIRDLRWKFIYFSNGAKKQLFDLLADPRETLNQVDNLPDIAENLFQIAIQECQHPGLIDALENGKLKSFPYKERPKSRYYQFDSSRGILGFPEKPEDALKYYQTKKWVY
jgi:choline-sulfatase